MRYQGGKHKLSHYILPIMLKNRKPNQYWVEPFVGGGSVISKVDGKRIGSDLHIATIEALKTIRDHYDELPRNNKEFTEEMYSKMLDGWDYKFKYFASFAYSFSGVFRGGWSREGSRNPNYDFVKCAYRSAVRQSMRLENVTLICCDYRDLTIPENSLIYCDPPYANTSSYKGIEKFDHDIFWQWCHAKHAEGHTIYISEYVAPKDFICVLNRLNVKGLRKQKGTSNHSTEKLFTLQKERKINKIKSGGVCAKN